MLSNEQAIEVLEKEKAYMLGHGGDRQAEAFNMAIKALEQQPSNEDVQRVVDYLLKPKSKPTSDDCVSRADLIDKLEILDKRYGTDFYWEVRKIVDILPPVTPTFPKGATNGDMIRIMFPKIEIYTDVINEIVDVEICEDSSELRCSIGWWNAPYKRGDSDGSN